MTTFVIISVYLAIAIATFVWHIYNYNFIRIRVGDRLSYYVLHSYYDRANIVLKQKDNNGGRIPKDNIAEWFAISTKSILFPITFVYCFIIIPTKKIYFYLREKVISKYKLQALNNEEILLGAPSYRELPIKSGNCKNAERKGLFRKIS